MDISVVVCADEDEVMGENLHRVKGHTEALFIASAEVVLHKILGKLSICLAS